MTKDLMLGERPPGPDLPGRFRAFLVAVPQYDDDALTDLPYVENDVRRLSEALRTHEDYDVTVVTGEEASLLGIMGKLRAFCLAANPDDTLLFFWTGHGEGEKGGEYRLVPRDCQRSLFALSSIPFKEFQRLVDEADARQKLVLLDTCNSGGAAGEAVTKSAGIVKGGVAEKVLEAWKGTVTMTSCGSDELSYIDERRQMSYFTRHLADALEGRADGFRGYARDGVLLFEEIYAYTYQHTKDEVLRDFGGRHTQRPNRASQGVEGDLVLAYLPGATRENALHPPSSMPASPGAVVLELSVRTEPPGAALEIDEVSCPGGTPHTAALGPGPHTIRITHPGHRPDEVRVVLEDRPLLVHRVLIPEHHPGGIRVTTRPDRAYVLIDGRTQADRTPALLELSPGIYDLVIRLQGYQDHSRQVIVTRGKVAEAEVEMREK